MLDKKRGIKKIRGSLLITNLIISLIAFSFLIGTSFTSALFGIDADRKIIEGTKDELAKKHIYATFDTKTEAEAGVKYLDKVSPKGSLPTTGGSSKLSEWLKIKNPAKGAKPGLLSWKTGGAADAIISGAEYALIAYYLVGMALSLTNLEEAQIEAAQKAAAWGAGAGKFAYTLFGKGGAWQLGEGLGAGLWGATGIGLAIAIGVYYYTYEEETYEMITFSCYPWDAPTKGEYCEKCNKQELPCSEYQCRSLGQACQLLNPGTDEEKCVWVNRNDIKPPVIRPWEDALLDGYEYKLQNTGISPPDTGVVIEYISDKCIPAFTPLSFGVTLDEPAKCKIDYLRKDSFDDMEFYFGESSLLKYNHTQVMSLPGPDEAGNITLRNNGEFELYARCQDANGNSNTANFVFKFCVEQGPDTTPPMIVGTTPLNEFPIAYNQTSIDAEIYVGNEIEPVECRWSHLDRSYENMEETVSCPPGRTDINAQILYECSTTLTGLKDKTENKFYFRCKDSSGNVNEESYVLTLTGTQPLVIDWAKPDETTIKDSTDIVQVTLEARTSAGYNKGEATCSYENTETGDGDRFYNTNSYEHSQDLWLPEGEYEYSIRCIDLGGNPDSTTVNFAVETDISEPIVVRVYHDETYLRIITNEAAECVYDTTDCSYSFDNGIKLTVSNEINHFTDWKTDTDFYIKCQDEYGKQPDPDKCSIIVRPSEFY